MISLDEMQVFLPSYLTSEGKADLYSQLAKFADDGSWQPYGTGSVYPSGLLQGDGVKSLTFVKLPALEAKQGAGVILSNSCDVDPANPRKLPAQVVYCPLIAAEKFDPLVREVYGSGAENFIKDTRAQATTSIVYFPEVRGVSGGFYGLLDQVCHIGSHSLPHDFVEASRIFTLSQVGHYLFLLKLSVHFTRIHEGIVRDSVVSS
jgi:hypothetical protein